MGNLPKEKIGIVSKEHVCEGLFNKTVMIESLIL